VENFSIIVGRMENRRIARAEGICLPELGDESDLAIKFPCDIVTVTSYRLTGWRLNIIYNALYKYSKVYSIF
jgi:hypothetical protein